MNYDKDKIDEVVLALMYLGLHDGRAWKSFDWDSLNRLHEKNLIDNPISKAKSALLTEKGEKLLEKLFKKYFASE